MLTQVGMTPVRLIRDQLTASGAKFRAGTILYIVREFAVNGRKEHRIALGYSDGRIVIPVIKLEEVEAC